MAGRFVDTNVLLCAANLPSEVIRIGGRRLQKAELRAGLLQALTLGLGRDVQLVDDGVTTAVGKTQANVFRGSKVSRFEEHDFCFAV